MPFTKGTKLGPFEILAPLGAGGMGEVYRAKDQRLDREVALKVLPPQAREDSESRQRFLREAKTASSLNHPNICTIFEVGEAAGQLFIAMELVEGQSLNHAIPPDGLAPVTLLGYAVQLTAAAGHAHARGILHRDLKPANVMVLPDGRLKVLDFGLASRFETSLEGVTQSNAGLDQQKQWAGTLPYLAPEVLKGEPPSVKSDLWALGVTFFEMASGRRPFKGNSGMELCSAILRDSPAALPSETPAGLRLVVEKCLAKEPRQRYGSAVEVEAALQIVPSSGIVRGEPPAVQPRRLRWSEMAVGAGLLLMIALALVWRIRMPAPSIQGPPRIASLAVLPLQNLSRDPDQQFFADGMTESLISSLAQVRALKVISRTSVMRYKGSPKSLPQIAHELGVDAVLEGSVQRVGQRVKITAQLIHAATDSHLWAKDYERDLTDVLDLQDEVARAVAGEIRIQVTAEESRRLNQSRRVVPAAYEAYLQGRYHRWKLDENNLKQAIAYYERAIQADPNYAAAYAGLSAAWRERGIWGAKSFREVEQPSRAAALKALELDDTLADAHAQQAALKEIYDWDWTTSESEYRKALALDPAELEALSGYATLLMTLGRFPEAIAAVGQALALDPLSSTVESSFGRICFRARKYDDAIAHLKRAIELDESNYGAYSRLGDVYEVLGRFSEAEAMLKEAASRRGRKNSLVLARVFGRTGRREEARRLIAEAEKTGGGDSYALPLAYAAIGDNGRALNYLEREFDQRNLVIFIKFDPLFDGLRAEPRFQALMERLKIPDRTAR